MINLFNVTIDSLSIHRVGNKSKGEGVFISENPYRLTNEITPLIKEYFFKPFREKEENFYQFIHEVDLEYNELYQIAEQMFMAPSKAHEFSKGIASHLYEQSNHPHIKSGELYIAYLSNVSIDNQLVEAIGIFKSELKHDFLQFRENQNDLDIILQQGVSLAKLDKGCIIFNYKKEEGYKILSVDTNRYDTKYWLEHFLNVDAFQDENFKTKKYLQFVQDFSKEVLLPTLGKKDEVLFNNRSVNYFAKNDDFEETSYLNEVFVDEPELIPGFKNYKVDRGEKYSIEDVTSFPISNSAVTDARKKIKNTIQLDTNIQIKLDFINPESANRFVEREFDEEKQMFYYKLYFNEEKKI
ncbi:MAG: nucleoid-associated protein [Bacteroidota bacterium]|nr:nucleoid-associated protein [Bacteroidota bacterium]